jgi:hypothetical protein
MMQCDWLRPLLREMTASAGRGAGLVEAAPDAGRFDAERPCSFI